MGRAGHHRPALHKGAQWGGNETWFSGINDSELVFSVFQYGGAPGGPTFPGQTQDPLYGYFAAVAGQVSFSLSY